MSLLEQQGFSLGARHPACSIQTHKHSHKAQEVTAKVDSYQDIAGSFFLVIFQLRQANRLLVK